MTKVEIFHKRDGSLRSNFGNGDGRSFVIVFAGIPVQRTIVVGTFFSTNSVRTVLEQGISHLNSRP